MAMEMGLPEQMASQCPQGRAGTHRGRWAELHSSVCAAMAGCIVQAECSLHTLGAESTAVHGLPGPG